MFGCVWGWEEERGRLRERENVLFEGDRERQCESECCLRILFGEREKDNVRVNVV